MEELLSELRQRLDSGEIRVMRPFGRALQYILDNARLREDGVAVWEEEDYTAPRPSPRSALRSWIPISKS